MVDNRYRNYERRSAPGQGLVLITPNDDDDLDPLVKSLIVFNVSGTNQQITLIDGLGVTNTLTRPPGLSHVPSVVTRVLETGTDGANLEIHGVID